MKTKYFAVFLFVVLMAASLQAGVIYYVDGALGSDTYSGTQSLPWKTIQKAANTMFAGDTVIVAAGVYPERITITRSGASDSLISFMAVGLVECQGFTIKADYIHIKGFKVTAPPIEASACEIGYGTWVTGKYCILENIFAYYCPRGGLCLRPESANCIIRFNRCNRNGMVGIEINGTGHLVLYDEVWGSCIYNKSPEAGEEPVRPAEADYISDEVDTFDGAKPRFLNRGEKRRSVLTLRIPRASARGVEWVDYLISMSEVELCLY